MNKFYKENIDRILHILNNRNAISKQNEFTGELKKITSELKTKYDLSQSAGYAADLTMHLIIIMSQYKGKISSMNPTGEKVTGTPRSYKKTIVKGRDVFVPVDELKKYQKVLGEFLGFIVGSTNADDFIHEYSRMGLQSYGEHHQLNLLNSFAVKESNGVVKNNLGFYNKPLNFHSMGFEKGKSITKNAMMHKDSDYTYQTDVSKFFDSVNRHQLVLSVNVLFTTFFENICRIIPSEFFRDMRVSICQISEGSNKRHVDALSYLTACRQQYVISEQFRYSESIKQFLNPHINFREKKVGLPTGSPLSPVLANISMYLFDWKVAGYLKKNEVLNNRVFGEKKIQLRYTYSRYADDIVISSKIGDYFEYVNKKPVYSLEMPNGTKVIDSEYVVIKNPNHRWPEPVPRNNVPLVHYKGNMSHVMSFDIKSIEDINREFVDVCDKYLKKELKSVGLYVNDDKTRFGKKERDNYSITGIRFNKNYISQSDKMSVGGKRINKIKSMYRALLDDKITKLRLANPSDEYHSITDEIRKLCNELVGELSFVRSVNPKTYHSLINWMYQKSKDKDAHFKATEYPLGIVILKRDFRIPLY